MSDLQKILEKLMYLDKTELLLVQQRVKKSLDSIEQQELSKRKLKSEKK